MVDNTVLSPYLTARPYPQVVAWLRETRQESKIPYVQAWASYFEVDMLRYVVPLVELTVWGEAEGEGPQGWAGVLSVIARRATLAGDNDLDKAVLAEGQFAWWDNPTRRNHLLWGAGEVEPIHDCVYDWLIFYEPDKDRSLVSHATHYMTPGAYRKLLEREMNGDLNWSPSELEVIGLLGRHLFLVEP